MIDIGHAVTLNLSDITISAIGPDGEQLSLKLPSTILTTTVTGVLLSKGEMERYLSNALTMLNNAKDIDELKIAYNSNFEFIKQHKDIVKRTTQLKAKFSAEVPADNITGLEPIPRDDGGTWDVRSFLARADNAEKINSFLSWLDDQLARGKSEQVITAWKKAAHERAISKLGLIGIENHRYTDPFPK